MRMGEEGRHLRACACLGALAAAALMAACAGDVTSRSRRERSDGGTPAAPDAGARDVGATGDASRPGVTFRKLVLGTEFLAEGASVADFDRDGFADVVEGPWIHRGPSFTEKIPVYPAHAFDPHGYSDSFFAFPSDLDGDGWTDVLYVGFPGQAATWYRNPGDASGAWSSHVILAQVDDESPTFVDVTGDGRPELVCATGQRLGYAAVDWGDATLPWTFHALSDVRDYRAFTHGLGVGDLDGDGRADVLEATGWWQQPASLAGDPVWTRHDVNFGPGGAQMLVSDVDGDGDADVITSKAAHGTGLSWYEQQTAKPDAVWLEHVIVRDDGTDLALHEPHALALADVNADGLPDIVTGERMWGHVPAGNPDLADPARLYWFELRREAAGPRFVPHRIDEQSGVGTQVVVSDVTNDGKPDIVVANKKGQFVLAQE
jgi:hypothetical protein